MTRPQESPYSFDLFVNQKAKTWTRWGLNPGPSACEADVMPLHHVPGEFENVWAAYV